MFKGLIRIISATILLGVFALALNMVLGNQTITFVEKVNVNTLGTNFYIWRFNFWPYINNLQLSATNVSELIFKLPTRKWRWMSNVFDGEALTNDLALMVDWVIMIINIILYPIRVTAYLIRNTLAICGVNNDTTNPNNGLSWLVIFVREVIGNFKIPYI